MLHGGIELEPTQYNSMSYKQFNDISDAVSTSFGLNDKSSVSEIEDVHWQNICRHSQQYAINNEISLFGSKTELWNLDRFTSRESNIHAKSDVSIFSLRVGQITFFIKVY